MKKLTATAVAAAIALSPVTATPQAEALTIEDVQRQLGEAAHHAQTSAQNYFSFVFAPVEAPTGYPAGPFYASSVWAQRAMLPIIGVFLAVGVVAAPIILIVQAAKGEIDPKEESSKLSSEMSKDLQNQQNNNTQAQ